MAESSPLGRSINLGSDQVPDNYCEQCHDIDGEIKPVAGYCLNCDQGLCQECYNCHLRPKHFRNHQLVDKRPKSKLQPQHKHADNTEKCQRHHGETLQSFCKTHSQICCKVCLAIDHQTCDIEDISKMARNIKSSGELEDLNKKLSTLKNSFNENLSKTETNRSAIQTNNSEARDEMKKLRDEFDRLMTETEKQAEAVKEEDLKQNQLVVERCNLITDQINRITSNLGEVKNKNNNENIFIAMKRAEFELQSFEESLSKLETNKAVREYKFEPDMKLVELMRQLKVLGQLSFLPGTCTSLTSQSVSMSQQMAKKPNYMKDIKVSSENLQHHGSFVLPNKQILITDYYNNKVKLIDTNNGTNLSEISLSGIPTSITKVKTNESAVSLICPNKIQILNMSQNSLSIQRDISVNGECYGIAYNDKDQTFVMAFQDQGKVEIINLTGTVIRAIQTDSKGSALFPSPWSVALSLDMSGIYVSDDTNHSVTLMTLNGDVKAVYKDNGLRTPSSICVHKSGVVYVVGHNSDTVYQIDPLSGEFKLLLNKKDGIDFPWSISYCDVEDKMYVGKWHGSIKVFEMK